MVEPRRPVTRRLLVMLSFVLSACGLSACGGAQIPADAGTTVLSLDHLDCGECGDRLAAKLRERPGVYRAAFDKRKAELAVVAARSFDALTEAKALSAGETYA